MENLSKTGGREQHRHKRRKEVNHFSRVSLSKKDLLSLLKLHGILVKPVPSFETTGQHWQINFI